MDHRFLWFANDLLRRRGVPSERYPNTNMTRRLPFRTCVMCDRTHEECGGRRLTATPSHVVRLCGPATVVGSLHHPARTLRLAGKFRDVIVVMSGQDLWTDAVARRVERACNAGAAPWFCQRCACHSICPLCGSPLTITPMADWIEEGGTIVHSPAFTGHVRECPNPDCAGSRTGIPTKEVVDWANDIGSIPPMVAETSNGET